MRTIGERRYQAQEVGPADRVPDGEGSPVGRRIVLGMLGLGALGVAVGSRVQSGIETALRPVTQNDPTGLSSFLPTGVGFRIYSVTPTMPSVTTADWSLTVDGMVDTPLDVSYGALLERPQAEVTHDFQCVTGWRVPDGPWGGGRGADLLDEAGVREGATHLRLYSFDGVYTESLTLDQARREDVLVVHRMLGAPVTREHGGPVRLFVAPMYGYKSLKWLDRIEVVDQLVPGYWEERGYDIDAWVGGSNGRQGDEPTSGATSPPAPPPVRPGRRPPAPLPARPASPPPSEPCTGRSPSSWGRLPSRASSSTTGRWPSWWAAGSSCATCTCGRASPRRCRWSWPTPVAGGTRSAATSAAWPAGAGPTADGCCRGAGRRPPR